MSKRCVVFDLDGTLLDTLGEIAESGNAMLVEMGREPRPEADYNLLAGQGLPYMVKNALRTEDDAEVERGCELVQAYRAKMDGSAVQPFDGAAELLAKLADAGWTLAVFSNKPHDEVIRQVAAYFPDIPFASVMGARPDIPVKPHPAGLHETLEIMGAGPEHTVYVGDTAADMKVGTAVGAWNIGVLWGFRDEDELRTHGAHDIVEELADLADAIEAGHARHVAVA
ncbi:MAG: HAD family hydrolase [Planctomycetota bacterium]